MIRWASWPSKLKKKKKAVYSAIGRNTRMNLENILVREGNQIQKVIYYIITFIWNIQNRQAQAMVFPVVVYGCESWTIKKADWWRIDAFELWYWRKLLRVPWTAERSNQSILMEICPEYSLEGLMLKLQYFGHLDAKSCLIGKDPDAGKDWRWEEKGTTEDETAGWHHWLNGHESEQTRETVKDREA